MLSIDFWTVFSCLLFSCTKVSKIYPSVPQFLGIGRTIKLGPNKKSRTNVTSVGSVFNDTRKVKVLSLPETIKEKSTFRAKALRRELVGTTSSRRRAFARNVDFSFIVSGSERTFTFRLTKSVCGGVSDPTHIPTLLPPIYTMVLNCSVCNIYRTSKPNS